MKRVPFNDGWQYREKVNPFAELGGVSAPYQDIALPHDATIGRDRDPGGEGAVAYFPGGSYQYRKFFELPPELDEQCVVLNFEGVYRDATVHINGHFAGQRPFGYSQFSVDAGRFLRSGETNEILVEARNHEDSRWYTGAGIYRPVWMLTGGDIHVSEHGLRVSTLDVDDLGATIEVQVEVSNDSSRDKTVDIWVGIASPDGVAAVSGVARATVAPGQTSLTRQRLYIETPHLWSAESPSLYTATARVVGLEDRAELDASTTAFGVRRLQLDPVHGLRVNGETVKLRGACIHHDNGILGAATFAAAEERRVRLLKEAGFNAIRSAHNPMSSALLDACDRLGMYVMDETFDIWTSNKTAFDYSLHFNEWWERDVESMVAKDYNHPSVIMYSIGNEIPETGSAVGGQLGRRLAEKVRSLDSTRYVTNAVNGMLAVLSDFRKNGAAAAPADGGGDDTGINTMMAGPGDFMNQIGASPLVSERTAESFSVLDVAGMNYLDSRYVMDKELFPNRVIVGTETFPTHIDHNWALVRENSHVIGDFTWTGWDYLGEVGIGRANYVTAADSPSLSAPYPWIAAWCGDIDLIGSRRPASYYREIVFGLRVEPYISVLRPRDDVGTLFAGPWTWSDSISSWSWPVASGTKMTVEVYSDAEQVELLLDGRSIGTAEAGAGAGYTARFDVRYAPGELTAINIRGGERAEAFSVQSAASKLQLTPLVEQSTNASDLLFVTVSLTDDRGVLASSCDREVTVDVSGPAVLQAFGSADPAPEGTYGTARNRTFDGKALVAVRPTGHGDITVRFSADGCEPVEVSAQRLR